MAPYYYQTITSRYTITDPEIGLCYYTADALSGRNETDAIAMTYLDGSCAFYGTPANSGDDVDRAIFFSVRFHRR